MLAFQLSSDRFNEGLLGEGLDHPTPGRLHHRQELARGKGLVVGEGHADSEFVVCLVKLIEVHAAQAITPQRAPA